MAVVQCYEAAPHAQLTVGTGGQRTWEAPWVVHVDSARDDGVIITDFLAGEGYTIGASFRYGDASDNLSTCKSIRVVRRADSVLIWDVTMVYGPIEFAQNGVDENGDVTTNPLDFRWDISAATQFYDEAVYLAWNYDAFPSPVVRPVLTLGPVHNSAGVVYDPPLMRMRPEMVVRITGNTPDYYSFLAHRYVGRLNWEMIGWSTRLIQYYQFREEWFMPYSVRCTGVAAEFRVENNIQFWRQSFEFTIRPRWSSEVAGPLPAIDYFAPQEGFLETIVDRGITRSANAGDPDGAGGTISAGDIEDGMGVQAPIRDWQNQRIPEMVLLDGAGQPLQAGNLSTNPAKYFRWIIDPRADFTLLPLSMFRK